MQKLTREDLWSLEDYEQKRSQFRKEILAHKKNRRVQIGEYAAIYFEDRLTIQYQIQEMLRIEKVFDKAGIEDELDTYNPLIPDGHNLKATFMFEIEDASERKKILAKLIHVEDNIWLRVGQMEKIFAICNEDLPRSTTDKTASVHFLRFELTKEMITNFKPDTVITVGVSHPEYDCETHLAPEIINALIQDFK